MKKLFIFVSTVAFLSLSSLLVAQQNQDTNTLFGDEMFINTESLGFFIAPYYSLTSFDGSSASLFNLRGGLNFKDHFSFGAYFNTSLNEINPESETVQGIYMDYWSVGGFAEYTLLSKKVVHLTFPLYVGYGEVQMDNDNGDVGFGEAVVLDTESKRHGDFIT